MYTYKMEYTLVNIILQIFCSLILVIMLASQLISVERGKTLNRIFMFVTILFIPLLLSDAVAWAVDQKPGTIFRALAIVSNIFTYSFGLIGTAVLILYIVRSIPLNEKEEKRVMGAAWSIVIAFHIILIASQFTGWVYSIDADNIFHWGPIYWSAHLAGILIYVVVIFVVLRNRKQIVARYVFAYMAYVALPVIALIINVFIVDLMLAHSSTALALLIIFVSIHIEREKLMKQKELELQNQHIAIMLSQIQPHFIYNTLSAIRELCLIDPQAASTTVEEFSDYLRINLDSITHNELITFNKELKHTETYLEIEKKRFENMLNIVYNINSCNFMIPPLTLQPIVENAVQHGITKKEGGGTVTINTDETESGFTITVTDNGVGFNDNESKTGNDGRTHVGIKNVRNRLAAMCEGKLNIESKPGVGTTVVITIPKITN